MLFDGNSPYLAHMFNGLEYFTPVLFLICLRLHFEDGFVLTYVEKGTLVFTALFYIAFMAQGPSTGEETEGGVRYYLISTQFMVDVMCVIFAYWTMFRNWSDDLLQYRRLARTFILCVTGPVIIISIVLYVYAINSSPAGVIYWSLLTNAIISIAIIIHCLFIIVVYFDLKPEFIKSASPDAMPEKTKAFAEEYEADLRCLKTEMEENNLYHDMELSLTKLAEEVNIPTYRLRKAINQGLGFRNFNAYLNQYRIAEAKSRLIDKEANDTILKISIEVGYKNLSTFNKAFKEICGVTPSEFRKKENIT
ncbi:helix-turn-helix domain-containing protein [Veronia nyctiphanis]|nr:helix-turn-helix domain-containing protein [Veronia nyctiphanis]